MKKRRAEERKKTSDHCKWSTPPDPISWLSDSPRDVGAADPVSPVTSTTPGEFPITKRKGLAGHGGLMVLQITSSPPGILFLSCFPFHLVSFFGFLYRLMQEQKSLPDRPK